MAMDGVVLGRELGSLVAMAAPRIGGMGLKPFAVARAAAKGQATLAAPVFDAGRRGRSLPVSLG